MRGLKGVLVSVAGGMKTRGKEPAATVSGCNRSKNGKTLAEWQKMRHWRFCVVMSEIWLLKMSKSSQKCC